MFSVGSIAIYSTHSDKLLFDFWPSIDCYADEKAAWLDFGSRQVAKF